MPKPNLSKILSANVIQSPQDDERFGLDWTKVKLGETVIQLDTKEVFVVINLDELDNPAGYLNLTASALGVTDVIGTSGEIVVTMSGTQATLSLANPLLLAGKTVTGGTFNGPTINNAVMVAPALGTPVSGVATNLTGTALGLTAGNALSANTVITNANLTGDVTSIGNATTLATVNGAPGTFGTSTLIPVITVNAKGLVTLITTVAIPASQPPGNYITALTGDVTATGPGSVAATLATVNGAPGTFGSAALIPIITVNGKGLVTSVTTVAMAAVDAGSLTGSTLAANVVNASLNTITPVGGTLTTVGDFQAWSLGARASGRLRLWDLNNTDYVHVNNPGTNTATQYFNFTSNGSGAVAYQFNTYNGASPVVAMTIAPSGAVAMANGLTVTGTTILTVGGENVTFGASGLGYLTTFSRPDANHFRALNPGGFFLFSTGGPTERMRITDAGIAVTGTTSATGTITAGTSLQVINSGITSVLGNDGGATVIGSISNHPTKIWVNSLPIGTFTTSGLSITGVISASAPTMSVAVTSSVGTQQVYMTFVNGGGNYFVGVENAAGSAFTATPYALITYAPSGRVIQDLIGGTPITTASATGLAVTGTITSSSSLTVSNGNLTVGDGAQNAVLILNGGTASSTGPFARFNRGGSVKWQVGCSSGILGGTSNALVVYDQALALTVISMENGAVTMQSALNILHSSNTLTVNGADGIIYRSGGNGLNAGLHRFRYFDTDTLSIGSNAVTMIAQLGVNMGGPNLAYILSSDNTSSANYLIFYNSASVSVGSVNRVGTTNAVSFNTSSDARLKENIRDFTGEDSGRLIDGLKPRWFDWKDGASKDVVGFIAQEEHAVDPLFERIGAVTVGDADPFEIKDRWKRSDSNLVPILVAELKSVRTRLQLLEATGRN